MDKFRFYTNILLLASVLIEIKGNFFFDYGGTGGLSHGNSHDSQVSMFGHDRGGFGGAMDDLLSASNPLDRISNNNFMDFEAAAEQGMAGDITTRVPLKRPRGRPPGTHKKKKKVGGTGWKRVIRKKDRMTAADKKLHRETFEEFQDRRLKEKLDNPETDPSRLLEYKPKKSDQIDYEPVKGTTETARLRFHTKISSWYWSKELD